MPKKIALLIGVSECSDRMPPHLAAVNNVTAMQQVLQDSNLGGFDRVETLINPDLETMQTAIQQVFSTCDVNDLALLFFSGQCIIDQGENLYFATSTTTQNTVESTAMSVSSVRQQLSNSTAERQIVILECCYSSNFAQDWQTKPLSLDINKELGDRGRIILTSSTTVKTSCEPEQASLSPYTQYLVEGIETGAADRDGAGLIYLRELHHYAKEKVQAIQPEIEPDIILDEKEFDILLTVLLNQDPNTDSEAEYHKIEAKYSKIVESYGRVGEIPDIVSHTLNKKQKTLGIAIDKDAPDDLSSDCGIDYTRLRDLLKAGEWKEADRETLVVMLKAANREQEGYLNTESVKHFPCVDLHTIDQLWIKYSNGQLGFSVQKEIWLSIGGEVEQHESDWQMADETMMSAVPSFELFNGAGGSQYQSVMFAKVQHDNAIYEQFGIRVGWRGRNGMKLRRGWIKYEDLNFSLTWASVGHLPTLANGQQMSFEEANFWKVKSVLFSRMDACWL